MKRVLPVLIFLITISVAANCQLISTIAGNGTGSFNGDHIKAITAEVSKACGIAMDDTGNIYLADYGNSRVRKINAVTGIITTVAGSGVDGYSGDGFAATSAEIDRPQAVVLDKHGNLYIADDDNDCIRKVTVSTGVITTIAGVGRTPGYNGDGILATTAHMNGTYGVAVDAKGNVYIADYNNNRVRKVDTLGYIHTFAGTGIGGYNGDNIAATTAEVWQPYGVAVDAKGNVYIGDRGNNRVRMVDTLGIIHTIAGTGVAGYNGDNIAATTAKLNAPLGVSADLNGNVFVAENGSNRIRRIDFSTGLITTVAGTGTGGYNGDGILATTAEVSGPDGVFVDRYGDVFIGDFGNNRFREIIFCTPSHAGTVSAIADSICFGNTANLKVAGSSGKFQWQSGTVPGSYTNISGATDSTYSEAPSQTTYYRIVSGAGSCTDTSSAFTLTVAPQPTAGVVSAPHDSICTGSIANLNVTGYSGTLQWQSGISVANFTTIADATNDTYSEILPQTTFYRTIASNGICTDTSSAFSVSVLSLPVAGTVSTVHDTICTGTTAQLTVTGYTGTLLWQSGISSASFSNITAATNNTYSEVPGQTTYYRVVAGNGICADTSAPVAVTLVTAPNAGTISTLHDTICANTVAHLNVSGHNGAIQWQAGTTQGSFTNIAGATDSTYHNILSKTTYYRIVSSNGICADTSAPFTLTVLPAPSADFASSDSVLKVTFNSDSIAGNVNSYSWSFGDNGTSSLPNPVHIYDTSGTYHVCLTVYNQSNCDFTICHNVTPYVNTGTQNISYINDFNIYPDPFTRSFYITVGSARVKNIEVYDMLGQVVLQKQIAETGNVIVIDSGNLIPGIYLLRINGEDFYNTRLIEKQ